MVFARIRRYKYRKEIERAGIPKNSPSIDIAVEFALRFPKQIEEDLFLLNHLSYQNPDDFKQELEAIWEVYQHGRRPLETTYSTLRLPFKPLERLIEIYGQGDRAGNILRALSGIRVGQDGNAESIYDARSRIGRQKADEFRVPEAALSVSKSPDEFLSNYVFSLLIFTELDYHHPGPCYEHIANLTRRHPDPAQYRKRLEDIMTEYAKEFYELKEGARWVGVRPNVVLYGFPSVAFLAEAGREREAIIGIRNFTTELGTESSYASNHLLQEILNPIMICSRTVEEMQECLNTVLESTGEIRQAGVKLFPPYFHFLGYLEDIVGSVDDFRQAMATTQRFFIRLGTSDFKFPQLDSILGNFAESVRFRDVGEFNATMEQIAGDMLQFPYGTEGGYAAETVDKIGRISSTPVELIRNNRLYGRLANSLAGAPCLDLVKTVNEQRDTTEDECVGALTRFYEKIKDTSEYKFSDYPGDSGPGKIWEEFFRANLLPKLLTVNRTGDFDVHLGLSTHTDSVYDDYMGDWTATYIIDAVHLDISPK